MLIIGGGPVGLTLANALSSNFDVTVIFPKRSFSFKKTEKSNFCLSPNSTSGTLYGNARHWGSQHEGVGNQVESKPIFSNLQGFPFDLEELNKFAGYLMSQGWPKLNPTARSQIKEIIGMKQSFFYKGKNFQSLPKSLNKEIRFIQKEFHNIEFDLTLNQKLQSVTIDQTLFTADIFVFAVGGLSNVALLSKLRSDVKTHNALRLPMLGKGYTNHPKSTLLKIRFSHPKFFGQLSVKHRYKLMKNWDLDDFSTESRPLRVSTRLWPIYNDSNLANKFLSRLLRIFGFYSQALVVVYLELPQISSNNIELIQMDKDSLLFHFDYFFPSELYDYFETKFDQIVLKISKNPSMTIVARENIDVQEIINSDANHHFGGTRMSASEEEGVVDSTSRCFEIQNLFILGTSTLPVSSFLHPTLLCAALALRAAEEISKND